MIVGIGFIDSIIVYNRYENVMGDELYFGTRFDGVRCELTQGENILRSGLEKVSSCTVKIPKSILDKQYVAPQIWKSQTTEDMRNTFTLDNSSGDFFVIVNKDDIGVSVDLPTGIVDSEDYTGGYFEYVKQNYGNAFQLRTVDVYTLIPRFQIGGT